MNNKSHNFSKLKKAFYTSLFGAFLAFIIGKVFDPIFEYLYTFFLTLGGSFVTHISDSTYQRISDGLSEQTSMILFYIIFIVCTSFLGVTFTSLKVLRPYEAEPKNESQPPTFSDTTPHDILTSIERLEKDTEKLKIQLDKNNQRINKLMSKRKSFDTFMYISTKIWIIFLMVLLVFIYSRNIFINKKIIVMTNNIEIVSPYISDIEYKQFKSDFHTIHNSYDYEELMQSLQIIADAHSITLKK